MRKKPLLAFDELERALDLSAKLLGQPQLAAVGDRVDDNEHASAGEAVAKCEVSGRVYNTKQDRHIVQRALVLDVVVGEST